MELHDILTTFLSQHAAETREHPTRAANRLRDRLGEALDLTTAQVGALAGLITDGSIGAWIERGAVPTSSTFDVATVDRWARDAWSAAIGAAAGAPPPPPPPPTPATRSATRSTRHPGDALQPLTNPRAHTLGEVVYARGADGALIRVITVQATVRDVSADALVERISGTTVDADPVEWVELTDRSVSVATKVDTVDSLASRLSAAGPLPPPQAMTLFATIGDALQHRHAAGRSHGAVTAESVVFSATGAPHLADAELAELAGRTVSPGADVRAFAGLLHLGVTGREASSTDISVSNGVDTPLRTALASTPGVAAEVERVLAGHEHSIDRLLAAVHQHVTVPAAGGRTPSSWAPPQQATVLGPLPPPSATTVVGRLDEQPDQRPGRQRAGLLVAIAAALVLVLIGGLVWVSRSDDTEATGGDSTATTEEAITSTTELTDSATTEPVTSEPASSTTPDTTESPTTTSAPAPSVTFPPFALAEGLDVTRSWTQEGSGLRALITITNTRGEPVAVVYDELLPDVVGASLTSATFQPVYFEVITPDRVVRWRTDLLAGEHIDLTYLLPLGATPDGPTLESWAAAWQPAYDAHVANPWLSPLDSDLDGWTDNVDACNGERGTAAGCTDSDNDQVADKDDRCIGEATGPLVNGCTDADADGFADSVNDQCKNNKGSANGCPDADNDGVADGNDQCRTTPGAKPTGCPAPNASVRINGTQSANDACGFTYTAVVSGITNPTYDWSVGNNGTLGSDGGPSVSVRFISFGTSYSSSVSVTVSGSGVTKSFTLPITVSPSTGSC